MIFAFTIALATLLARVLAVSIIICAIVGPAIRGEGQVYEHSHRVLVSVISRVYVPVARRSSVAPPKLATQSGPTHTPASSMQRDAGVFFAVLEVAR